MKIFHDPGLTTMPTQNHHIFVMDCSLSMTELSGNRTRFITAMQLLEEAEFAVNAEKYYLRLGEIAYKVSRNRDDFQVADTKTAIYAAIHQALEFANSLSGKVGIDIFTDGENNHDLLWRDCSELLKTYDSDRILITMRGPGEAGKIAKELGITFIEHENTEKTYRESAEITRSIYSKFYM